MNRSIVFIRFVRVGENDTTVVVVRWRPKRLAGSCGQAASCFPRGSGRDASFFAFCSLEGVSESRLGQTLGMARMGSTLLGHSYVKCSQPARSTNAIVLHIFFLDLTLSLSSYTRMVDSS